MTKINWDKAAYGPMGLAYPDKMTLLEKLESSFKNKLEPDLTSKQAHETIIFLRQALGQIAYSDETSADVLRQWALESLER